MIKFFRKIRQNLLSEGKTGKYLKYAIGEILLVVIGILIALQINNWNESKKEVKLKEKYYQQLLSDFENDNNYAKERILSLTAEINKIQDYNNIYTIPNLGITEIFASILKNNFNTTNLEYKTSTIETLINTGDIKLFNPKLRSLLTQYNKSKIQSVRTFTANMDNLNDLLKEAALRGGSVLQQQSKFLNQPQLKQMINIENRKADIYIGIETYLIWKANIYNSSRISLDQNVEEAEGITEIINTELEK